MASRRASARRTEDVARVSGLYGEPVEIRFDIQMREWEFNLLRYSKRDGRFRDATILIPWEGKLVCIVKHGYPEGIARPPSGGVVPGEPLDAAAEREAFEETGLRVRIERYLLVARCHFRLGLAVTPSPHALAEASRSGRQDELIFDALARFASESPAKADEPEYWESHVFWANPIGGQLAPRDTTEIKEVRLLAPEELERDVHARMRASDIGGFDYRVALQEAALDVARRRGLLT
ncbi:MAG TPA: NUDIX domain-containing protein [Candidatus Thermoplasmatota archaeon]|nr:NUDIX domain-containing protein [Candidatus Thermoplasmatota archaeon]